MPSRMSRQGAARTYHSYLNWGYMQRRMALQRGGGGSSRDDRGSGRGGRRGQAGEEAQESGDGSARSIGRREEEDAEAGPGCSAEPDQAVNSQRSYAGVRSMMRLARYLKDSSLTWRVPALALSGTARASLLRSLS